MCKRAPVWRLFFWLVMVNIGCLGTSQNVRSEDQEVALTSRTITGFVQYPNLQRVTPANVELRDKEGTLITTTGTNESGEFVLVAPHGGIFSIRALQSTARSQYAILKIGDHSPAPVVLTLGETQDIALEVIAPLLPLQDKVSGETYSLNRKDIELIPRGNNIDFNELLLTIPSALNGSLKQVHIRQDHANFQVRMDGVPIPDTVSSVFTDVITPRVWERADIILGGPEALYGNRTAAVIDITSKSGSRPGFGSVQMFGGSNETVNPSFEYGGMIGHRTRFYVMNSFTTTNRGIDPPTLGKSVFHDQSNRNQTFLRSDFQIDNRNTLTWLLLNSVAKFQIPTSPGKTPNADIVGLIQAQNPSFQPVASQAVNENQEENNQYSHLVWRSDIGVDRYLTLAGYFRQTRATFVTDPLNVLSYTSDVNEPFSAGSQDRMVYSGGIRFDYAHRVHAQHLLKTGFQVERTQAVNKTRLSAFNRVGGNPSGGVIALNADNRTIGYREEFWVQDQSTPTDRLTFNLGVRFDNIHGFVDANQVSPRIGMGYKITPETVARVYYGRLFTPPNLESIPFLQLNTIGTTAQPENTTYTKVQPERAHYFEVGLSHAIGRIATFQIAAYYKYNKNLSDAGQFGTTPLLNTFAFASGYQEGIDGSVKINVSKDLSARGNVAWGRCKGKGLQSGYFLLGQQEINDINSNGGIFCDHSQTITSSAVVAYRPFPHTTITGEMLFGSGLRTADPGAKTNSSHVPSYTVYNFSIDQVIRLSVDQKLLLGFDIINAFNQEYFLNQGEGSIGLGVAHAGMPRSFFFRAQWFFES